MSERADNEYLIDIKESISRITNYIKDMTYNDFMADEKTQDAVIRNLEIIGEASKGISTDFRLKNSAFPWHEMMGVRNRLIHDYFGVNLDIVWQIILDELPKLSEKIKKFV